MMLKILYFISWVLFIGLCIDAGGFLTNTIYTSVIDSKLAKNFWGTLDLSGVYFNDFKHFLLLTTIMNIVAIFKALLFYSIVKLLHDKKLNMKQPFNYELGKFISNIAYITLFIGLFSFWARNYVNWLESKTIQVPSITSLKIDGHDIWFFMGIVLLVIAQIFRRGIEIQQENELTI